MDFPWTGGTFVATPAFEPVRPLFDALRAVPNKKSSDEIIMREFEEAWQRIAAPDLRLAPDEPGEETITTFILQIDGDRFRLGS